MRQLSSIVLEEFIESLIAMFMIGELDAFVFMTSANQSTRGVLVFNAI